MAGGGEDDDQDKQYEPSHKKLQDAREKGEIPRSTDVTTAAAYAGLLLAAMAAGGAALVSTGEVLMSLIDRPDSLARLVFESGGGSQARWGGLMGAVMLPLVPFFALPAVLALISVVATRSFTVTPDKLAPKLNRISIVSQAKNKFGRSGLFEFAKSFAKLTIYSAILGLFLATQMDTILGAMALSPGMVATELLRMAVTFLALVLLVAVVVGIVDFGWQWAEHMRKNRMSHKEMTDEHKQMEGDPHVKQQRRQKGYDIATNKMMADVPGADVIVVNPTHYAVALKWDRQRGSAPVCVAKGVDEIARTIREIAAENGIAVHRDPPTARALHATVEIGEEVRPEHYRAVAAAIRFAEAMRAKAGRAR